ncbi:MAG: T9SS type A sorting domain-containing protein [Bacteroidota bacterium]
MQRSLLLLTSCCLALAVQAQIEFGTLGAKYYAWSEYQNGNDGPFLAEMYTIEVMSDTIIEGTPCRKMYPRHLRCEDVDDSAAYVTQMGSQVRYWNPVTSQFDLLYDFSKMAGKSWTIPTFCGGAVASFCPVDSLTVHVDSTTTVDLGATTLNVQHVTVNGLDWYGPFNRTIYEGVGCIEFLFYLSDGACSTAHYWERGIRCYEDPNVGTLSFFTDGGTCDMLTNTTTFLTEDAFTVFPNPVSHQLQVVGKGTFSVRIYDAHGRLLSRFSELQDTALLDFSTYAAGVYLLRFNRNGAVSTRRVVKE